VKSMGSTFDFRHRGPFHGFLTIHLFEGLFAPVSGCAFFFLLGGWGAFGCLGFFVTYDRPSGPSHAVSSPPHFRGSLELLSCPFFCFLFHDFFYSSRRGSPQTSLWGRPLNFFFLFRTEDLFSSSRDNWQKRSRRRASSLVTCPGMSVVFFFFSGILELPDVFMTRYEIFAWDPPPTCLSPPFPFVQDSNFFVVPPFGRDLFFLRRLRFSGPSAPLRIPPLPGRWQLFFPREATKLWTGPTPSKVFPRWLFVLRSSVPLFPFFFLFQGH